MEPESAGNKLGIGMISMPPAYKNAEHKPDIPGHHSLVNAHAKAVLIRQTWELIEPVKGEYDLSYLTESIKTCNDAGKKVSLQILAGQHRPKWFPTEECVNIEGVGWSTLVFTPEYQSRWAMLQEALAKELGNNKQLVSVVMGGIGSGSESFVVKKEADIEECRALAIKFSFADEIVAWESGVAWSMDLYSRTWKQPFALVTGPPFGSSEQSVAALQAMFDYGLATYYGKFGARSHDLTSGGPNPGQISCDVITAASRSSSATVCQMGNAQIANDTAPPTRLRQALQRGYDNGANGVEVFDDDFEHESSQEVLAEFNALFLSR